MKCKELEDDLVRALNEFIDDIFNSHVVSREVCFSLPTKSLIEAYLEMPELHVVKDRQRLWIVFAKGINNYHFTGWMKRFSSKVDFEFLLARMATCHNCLRLIDYEVPDTSILACKYGDTMEVPGCLAAPDEFKDRLLTEVNWLANKQMSQEEVDATHIKACPK